MVNSNNIPGFILILLLTAMVASILSLKSQNPNLKVLLAVGGWSHGPGPFSAVAATDSGIDVWAANVTSYLRQRGLDGLDVDWEYPVGRGTPASDKQRFTAFLQVSDGNDDVRNDNTHNMNDDDSEEERENQNNDDDF